MRVLHITTHMGGGIGNALSSLVCADNLSESHIILLEKPVKTIFIDKVDTSRCQILCCPDAKTLINELLWSDVVILHWWHHPVMCEFMANFPQVPVRLILESHVSGCNYPYLKTEFVNLFSEILFTSTCSYDNSFWTKQEIDIIRNKSRCVYGLGELSKVQLKDNYSIRDSEIRIAYVGTLSRSKMHPQFIEMCESILQKLPNAHFYIFGDAIDGDWIKKESIAKGINNHIHLEGYSYDIPDVLKEYDIFGYPLNPLNYATTENSLLEAMAAGLPIVVMNQGTEKYIIDDGRTGLTSEDVDDYVKNVITLAESDYLRKKYGEKARKQVREKYSVENNAKNFQDAVKSTLSEPKRTVNFVNVIGDNPRKWLCSAMNPNDLKLYEEGKIEELPDIFREKNKSSLGHFARYFPELG